MSVLLAPGPISASAALDPRRRRGKYHALQFLRRRDLSSRHAELHLVLLSPAPYFRVNGESAAVIVADTDGGETESARHRYPLATEILRHRMPYTHTDRDKRFVHGERAANATAPSGSIETN